MLLNRAPPPAGLGAHGSVLCSSHRCVWHLLRALCAPSCTKSLFHRDPAPRVPPAAVTRAGTAGRRRSLPGSSCFPFPSLPTPSPSVSAGGGRLCWVSPRGFCSQAKHEFSKDLLNLRCLSPYSVFTPELPHGLPASQQSSWCAARGWQGLRGDDQTRWDLSTFTHPQLPPRQQGEPAGSGDEKVKQEAKRESKVQS